jgi:hypothetical protein
MRPVFVRGLGLWTPEFPNVSSWCLAKPEPDASKAPASLLSGALRRRSTEVTRMGIEALTQAAEQAGCDLGSVPTVWATAQGEHSTALQLLAMMHEGDGRLSPKHFHNSVHNSPSGYASIAARNVAVSTTVTGGRELVSAALLEAMCMVDSLGGEAVLVLCDEALKTPFAIPGSSLPLAMAFCLGDRSEGALARVSDPRRDALPLRPHERFGHLAVSAGLPLLERIANRLPGRVSLEFGVDDDAAAWAVDVAPSER